MVDEIEHLILQEVPGDFSKTFSLAGQGLNVLGGDKKNDGLLASLCAKVGPCPCDEPCLWAVQALDAMRLDGWPDPDQPHSDYLLIDTRD